jgi:hypothetical protein
MSIEQAAFPAAFDEYPVGEGRCLRDAAWWFNATAPIIIVLINLETSACVRFMLG